MDETYAPIGLDRQSTDYSVKTDRFDEYSLHECIHQQEKMGSR